MISEKIDCYSDEIKQLFAELKKLIYAAAPHAEERLWAGMPSYYAGEKFVRLIPFKDHINIEGAALEKYKGQLTRYRFTPKNMLQIFVGQTIPAEVLKSVFGEVLS